MLSYEEAQKRLKPLQIKNWEKLKIAAMGELPEKLRTAGRAILDRDANGKPFKDWQKRHQAQQTAIETLNKSSSKDRQRIFAILFPKLREHLLGGIDMAHFETPFDLALAHPSTPRLTP